MKTGLTLCEDNIYFARWRDANGKVFTQRKRLSKATLRYLSERDLDIIKLTAKHNMIAAIKQLKDNEGFTLREAIRYVRNLIQQGDLT